MGVDPTMEMLVSVIRFMSENAPADGLRADELRPDQKRKLERFREHADYLLSQYRNHQGIHVTLLEARKAIGYDYVRALKIQAWLMNRSVEALDDHDGDAKRAFRHLTTELHRHAIEAGHSAEETAIRFLLAEEFLRCNVFPNPTDP